METGDRARQQVSVVIASIVGSPFLDSCLDSLQVQARERGAEVVVVACGASETYGASRPDACWRNATWLPTGSDASGWTTRSSRMSSWRRSPQPGHVRGSAALLCPGARQAPVGRETPQHALVARTLCERYPQATVIHIVRDPREVVASLLRMPWGHRSIVLNTRTWMSCAEGAELARDLPNYLLVRHQSLVDQPHQKLQRFCIDVATGSATSPPERRLRGPRPSRPAGTPPSSSWGAGSATCHASGITGSGPPTWRQERPSSTATPPGRRRPRQPRSHPGVAARTVAGLQHSFPRGTSEICRGTSHPTADSLVRSGQLLVPEHLRRFAADWSSGGPNPPSGGT